MNLAGLPASMGLLMVKVAPKKLVKHITQRMEEDAAWRVIVLKNCWLCPFCGEVGAQDLSMDDQVEEKIARHLLDCSDWTPEESRPLPQEKLQKQALLITFKNKIQRTIHKDPLWQYVDVEGCWICPYCARATDINLKKANESGEARDSALNKLARHLLECEDCNRGEGQERSKRILEKQRERINEKKKKKRLKRRIATEAVWAFRDTDKRWLCPFCAETAGFTLVESDPSRPEMVEKILEHLEVCRAYEGLKGRPHTERYLKDKVSKINKEKVLLRLRRKLEGHEIWQIRDVEQHWYCPYCARGTSIKVADPRAIDSRTLKSIWKHLTRCNAYAKKKARIKSRNFLRNVVAAQNKRLELKNRIRQNLAQKENWTCSDIFGSWICPFCRKVNKPITLRDEAPLVDKTIEQILNHLEEHCSPYQDGAEAAPLDELEEIAGSLDRGSGIITGSAAGIGADVVARDDDWKKTIDREMNELRSQVQVNAELERSLEEARSKQIHMLPRVPDMDGYEFACVYKPCSSVGGDFYSFIRVSETHLGIAIGDISGHGYDAALLVGVSKKLLEIYGRNRPSPAQTLVLANTDVYPDLDAKTFVTVFYGILDTRQRSFKFSRAGHNPLVLYNPQRTPPLQVLDSKGMALGMDNGPIFKNCIEELEVQLHSGDVLVQYTDGVTETMNRNKEEFGPERMVEIIERYGHHEAEYLLYKIDRALESFRAGARQKDDITMIAVKVH